MGNVNEVDGFIKHQQREIVSLYYRLYYNALNLLLYEKCNPREWARIEDHARYKAYAYHMAMVAAHAVDDLADRGVSCADAVVRLFEG